MNHIFQEMPDLKIENLRNEINAWTRTLRNMSEENIGMKTRLSEILKHDFDIRWLPQVENFHSLLLTEEEFINLLRHNISELDRFANQAFVTGQRTGLEYEHMQSRLEHQMKTAEIRFAKLKSELNTFFAQLP